MTDVFDDIEALQHRQEFRDVNGPSLPYSKCTGSTLRTISSGHVISLPVFCGVLHATRRFTSNHTSGWALVAVSQTIFVAGCWMMESIVCCALSLIQLRIWLKFSPRQSTAAPPWSCPVLHLYTSRTARKSTQAYQLEMRHG